MNGIDEFYEDFMHSMVNVQNAVTGGLIIATGQAANKLDTAFEQELFAKYWDGDASDYSLSQNDLDILISDYNSSNMNKYDYNTIITSGLDVIDDNNGNRFYYGPLNGYALGNKYDFSVGSATGIYDNTGGLVGINDKYDFNPGNRSGMAEFATRAVNAVSHPDVAEYHIIGGNIPEEVFNRLKSFQP